MDLFQLIIRIIAFAVTLYLLLEFIAVCRVSTVVGIFITLGATVIVILVFILFKRYDVITCQTCKQKYAKKII